MISKRKSKAKKWIILACFLIVVIAAVLVYMFRQNNQNFEEVAAKMGSITTYNSFSGNIEAKNHQTVISEKLMQISEIRVKNGDQVNEGDVLIVSTIGDEIASKISGEVQGLNLEENATIMAGVKLLEIIDYNNLQVNIKVDEYDLPSVKIGKETNIKINALNKDVTGTINDLSKTGTSMNGVTFFIATVNLEEDPELRIGMSCEVKLLSNQAVDVLTLPMSVIQFNDDNTAYVLKEGENGRAEKVEIATGINDGNVVEIKSGVINGEKILYSNDPLANLLGRRVMGGRR